MLVFLDPKTQYTVTVALLRTNTEHIVIVALLDTDAQ
jgi:hypothetical protein